MITSVVYPPRAAQALGYLNSSRNDIEVFVEDSSAPNLWIKLLRNLLPNGIRLNSVNILGSRDNVLAACREDQLDDGRKKIYLIDADLDLLKGKSKPRLKHLYRLRAYCVENYLIKEENLISLATNFDVTVSEAAARQRLDFSGWRTRNMASLNSLFVCYAVTHSLASSEKTVGYSVFRLLDEEGGQFDFCQLKVSKRVVGLYRIVIGEKDALLARSEFHKVRNNALNFDFTSSVSAKDYILPQIFRRMKANFGVNVSLAQFKVMLAGLVGRDVDPYLVRRLARICN